MDHCPGERGGAYTVQAGDTLRSVASAVYGDSQLWYLIAGANGLAGEAGLAEGATIILPAGVTRNTNRADTFQPFNPADAIGDTSPAIPQPGRGNQCGILGQILLAVVAVAVTVVTAGQAGPAFAALYGTAFGAGTLASGAAAITAGAVSGAVGSIVSQGLGVATGIQDKFSFKSVGLAAIGGGVGASGFGKAVAGGLGIAKEGFLQAGISGAANNALTQGIGVATGLQNKFSFAGVAAAGVGAAASFGASKYLPGAAEQATEFYKGVKIPGSPAEFGNILASNTAGGIANAATRSALTGTSFGDSFRAAIPDIISGAVGDALQAARQAADRREAIETIDARDAQGRLGFLVADLYGRTGRSDGSNGPGIEFDPDYLARRDAELINDFEIVEFLNRQGQKEQVAVFGPLGEAIEGSIRELDPNAPALRRSFAIDPRSARPSRYTIEDIYFLAESAANLYDVSGNGLVAPPPLYYDTRLDISALQVSTGDTGSLLIVPVPAAPGRAPSLVVQQVGAASTGTIGRSGFTPESLSNRLLELYQRAYNDGAATYARLEAAGRLPAYRGPANTREGAFIDRRARDTLREFLRGEGIPEGPNQDVRINRRLYSEDRSRFRVPDVYIVSAGRIFDGTTARKTLGRNGGQVRDFSAFSGIPLIEIVRPDTHGGPFVLRNPGIGDNSRLGQLSNSEFARIEAEIIARNEINRFGPARSGRRVR